eukprot:CAMPEP_0182427746 /NCGR_PEP_ID=MMETSP1167-20130531/19166_1 /TAXON_ID=2988 /ORGANISM="Mallomonas Sp, Strain CCMP3275" /LENGTH=123 /DNA_ID=CAMNT_0024610197 /DNA_START=106 /DNA_END=477 /DNA_ORIENTATION=+
MVVSFIRAFPSLKTIIRRKSSSVAMVDVDSMIKDAISANKVMIFSKSYCPFCTRAKSVFSGMNTEFKAVELDEIKEGAEIQAALLKMSGQRTVPNVYVNGKHLGGCDSVMSAKADGSLAKMLK